MIRYLKNSELSARIGLNPFNWKWIPGFAYEAPTPVYPKRRTFALIWLGVQLYLDIDDGTHDMSMFEKLFNQAMDVFDEERKVGREVLETRKGSLFLE